jgi:hypothetical protein
LIFNPKHGENAMTFDETFKAADQNRPAGQITMGAAFRELRRMTVAGATEAEQKAYLDQCFPDDPEEERRRGPKCRTCFDSGWARIMSAKAVKAAVDGKIDRSTVDVRCKCKAGDRIADDVPKTRGTAASGRPVVTLGDFRWHIPVSDPDHLAKAAQYVHRPAGYNPAFTSFE